MEAIKSFIGEMKPARKQTRRNMTVFPLMAPDGDSPDFLTLEEALEKGSVRISEVSDEGRVSDLNLVNSGRKNVLIVEGEELLGAKQNRIVNATFLIAGNTEILIPVSCVEQGRWNYKSRYFSSGDKIMPSSIRSATQREVKASLGRGEGFRSDQGRIWEDIDDKAFRLDASSDTGAMDDIFDKHEDLLDDYAGKFKPVEYQTGVVVAINGRIVGLEAFGYHDTMRRFFDKLIKSYVLDAIDWLEAEKAKSVAPEKIRRFLDSVSQAPVEEHLSFGLGTSVGLESKSVTGAALVHNNRVLHLSAFKKETNNRGPRVGFERYSTRRKFRAE